MAKEQRMVPAPRRVFALQYGYLHDKRAGVTFHETTVAHPTEPGAPRVQMGMAVEVAEDVVARWYFGHPGFHLDGYDMDELRELRAKLDGPMHSAGPAGTPEAPKSNTPEPVVPAAPAEAPQTQPAEGEAPPVPAAMPEVAPVPPAPADAGDSAPGPLDGVRLASDTAKEAAVALGLVAVDFRLVTPSGAEASYTAADVRKVKAEKDRTLASA